MIITFVKPVYLYLTVLIPLVILIHFFTLKRKRASALSFANFDAIARVRGVDLLSKNLSILVLTALIALSLILAVSGLTIHRQLESSSSSFVLAIDTSRSMEATDVSPSRFEAAKETARSFIESLPSGTNIGVVSFSGNALIEQAVTNDKTLLKQAVSQISLSSVGGTDLYEAVLTSTNLLEGEEAKAVILLSDGRINVGTIDDLIAYANKNSVTVHTIALGTIEGGETTYGLSTLDEDSLKAAAYNTEGKFFTAASKEELQNSFNTIVELKTKQVAFDLSSYLILLALALLVIEFVLVNTRYNILP